MPNIKTIRIYKIRGALGTPSEILNETSKSVPLMQLNSALGLTGGAFYFSGDPRQPQWTEFVNGVLESPIAPVSQNASAVIVFESAGEWFAVSFGHGFTHLDNRRIEKNFGLKVCLNLLDAESIKQLETRTLENTCLSARKQVSRPAPSNAFRIDVDIDLLRGISGTCSQPCFATRLAGNNSLEVTCLNPIPVGDLPEIASQCLEASRGNRYRERGFDWVDNISEVTTPELIEHLNTRLIDDILSAQPSAYLAAPDVMELGVGVNYAYSRRNVPWIFADLNLSDLVSRWSEHHRNPIRTSEDLIKADVYARYQGETQWTMCWSAYDCLIWEVEHEDQLYILNSGSWYQVARTYYEGLQRFFAQLPILGIDLPIAELDESEEDYNERVADLMPELVLMDQKFVTPSGAASNIEICDLFGQGGQLIHVKRKTGSATLSHLFSQGCVSAQSLLEDQRTRNEFVEILRRDGTEEHVAHVERNSGDHRDYEVSFVILSARPRNGNFRLPFFSLVNLRQRCKELRLMGVRTSFRFVEQRTSRQLSRRAA